VQLACTRGRRHERAAYWRVSEVVTSGERCSLDVRAEHLLEELLEGSNPPGAGIGEQPDAVTVVDEDGGSHALGETLAYSIFVRSAALDDG
jgi:hypothetical protein